MFLLLYLALSLLVGDFYAMPITVAFLLSCLYSLVVLRGRSVSDRFQVLTEGASSPSLLLMIWIFILAGAFASAAKGMGAIEATVNLTLAVMPESLILPGLFLAACFGHNSSPDPYCSRHSRTDWPEPAHDCGYRGGRCLFWR